MAASLPSQPCRRCKADDAQYKMRNLFTCRNCYIDHVESKARKSISIMHKELRTSTDLAPRRYLAALSFGPSSTCLAHILDGMAAYHQGKASTSPFEPLVVHVDTDLAVAESYADGGRASGLASATTPAQRLLAKYRQRYPHVSFDCVHLSRALALKTVGWSALLPASPAGDEGRQRGSDSDRLRAVFDALPSVTSRADVLRQLVRHVLIDVARERGCSVVLFGHSASALAALTLAEVANGRGFSVPAQVGDGPQTVCEFDDAGTETARARFPVYYPLRDVLRNELAVYMSIVPALAEAEDTLLVDASNRLGGSVVSHRDVSIEEVMQRYFDGVEGPYAGIVANVVRTAGKLERVTDSVGAASLCRLCGMTLDESGDDRWAGDLGQDSGDLAAERHKGKLCYGCRRSVNG